MKEFSLRSCLIPELLRNEIDFRIIKYEDGNHEKPISLIVSYRYLNICKIDLNSRKEGLFGGYHVKWYNTKTSCCSSQDYYNSVFLIKDIHKAIIDLERENTMNKKIYRVKGVKFNSDRMHEIDLTVNVLESHCATQEDFAKIREAIESIGEKNESYYVVCGRRNGKTRMYDDYYSLLLGRSVDWRKSYEKERDKFDIKDVIFNDPATIVLWADGTKTVVKAENEPFDPEKGLAMAISKRAFGNKHSYYDIFKKYVGRYEKKQNKEV